MSIQLIQKYYADVDKIIRYGGSRNESSLRKPFQDLLEQYARAKNLVVVAEVEMTSKRGTRIRPDGVLKDALRQEVAPFFRALFAAAKEQPGAAPPRVTLTLVRWPYT